MFFRARVPKCVMGVALLAWAGVSAQERGSSEIVVQVSLTAGLR